MCACTIHTCTPSCLFATIVRSCLFVLVYTSGLLRRGRAGMWLFFWLLQSLLGVERAIANFLCVLGVERAIACCLFGLGGVFMRLERSVWSSSSNKLSAMRLLSDSWGGRRIAILSRCFLFPGAEVGVLHPAFFWPPVLARGCCMVGILGGRCCGETAYLGLVR